MKFRKSALLAAASAVAIAFGGTALQAADTSTDVPGSSVEDQGTNINPGALNAPEKGSTVAPTGAGSATGGTTDNAAANVPGASAEGDDMNENQGALSAPEKDAEGDGSSASAGQSDDGAANVPGSSAEGDDDNQNQGALSAPEKDRDQM